MPCDKTKDVHEEHYRSGTEPVLDLSHSGRCVKAEETEKTEKGEPEL